MTHPTLTTPRRAGLSVLGIASVLALTACSGGAGGTSAGSTAEGSMADMAPVTLVVQSPYGPNHFMSEMWVDYADVIEEKSDGKLTFDISYSSALSPVAEQEAALRDGLLDMAWSMPAYNPTALPLNGLVTEAAFLTEQTPIVSQLQGYGSAQFGMESEALQSELTDAGLVSLLTMVQQMPNNPMICTDEPVRSLSDFQGKNIRVPGAGWATEVEALGASPVNMPQNDVYEALERGIIDCAVQSPGNTFDLGMLDVVDYYHIDSEINFQGWNGTHIVVAERVWNELPLDAQQLLWDEAGETLLRSMIVRSFDAVVEELVAADEQVEVVDYEDDVRQALTDQRTTTLEDLDARASDILGEDQTLFDDYASVQAEWLDVVTEAGYTDDANPEWIDWAQAYVDTPTDVDAFIAEFMDRVQTPNRPE